MSQKMETILAECARRRGVGAVPYRILGEFAWFVEEWIQPMGNYELREEIVEAFAQLRKNRRFVRFPKKPEAQLLIWAELFREYCKLYRGNVYVREQTEKKVSGNPSQEGEG